MKYDLQTFAWRFGLRFQNGDGTGDGGDGTGDGSGGGTASMGGLTGTGAGLGGSSDTAAAAAAFGVGPGDPSSQVGPHSYATGGGDSGGGGSSGGGGGGGGGGRGGGPAIGSHGTQGGNVSFGGGGSGGGIGPTSITRGGGPGGPSLGDVLSGLFGVGSAQAKTPNRAGLLGPSATFGDIFGMYGAPSTQGTSNANTDLLHLATQLGYGLGPNAPATQAITGLGDIGASLGFLARGLTGQPSPAVTNLATQPTQLFDPFGVTPGPGVTNLGTDPGFQSLTPGLAGQPSDYGLVSPPPGFNIGDLAPNLGGQAPGGQANMGFPAAGLGVTPGGQYGVPTTPGMHIGQATVTGPGNFGEPVGGLGSGGVAVGTPGTTADDTTAPSDTSPAPVNPYAFNPNQVNNPNLVPNAIRSEVDPAMLTPGTVQTPAPDPSVATPGWPDTEFNVFHGAPFTPQQINNILNQILGSTQANPTLMQLAMNLAMGG